MLLDAFHSIRFNYFLFVLSFSFIMMKILKSLFGSLKELRSKYRNAQEQWMIKTPWQKWKHLYNIGKAFGESIGIRVYGDMKNTWYTASGGVLGLIYLFLAIYTVQYHLRQRNFTRAMACSYAFGLFILVNFGILLICRLILTNIENFLISLFK